jgi:hypothetical protein
MRCSPHVHLLDSLFLNNPNGMLQQVYLSAKKLIRLPRHKLVALCVSKFQLAELCELFADFERA